jgi:hypothetical protein
MVEARMTLEEKYQKLLEFARFIEESGCDLEERPCKACEALDVIRAVGEKGRYDKTRE